MNNKKILLIHHRLPYPLYSGMDKTRFSLIKMLNQVYRVTLIVLNFNKLDDRDVREVKKVCFKLIVVNDHSFAFTKPRALKKIRTFILVLRSLLFGYPVFDTINYSKKFKNEIKRHIESGQFDIIQPLSDYSMRYAVGLKCKSAKFFGPNDDMVGMTEGILHNKEKGIKRLLLKIELKAREKWQERMIQEPDKICYFSKEDIKNILSRNPEFKDRIIWMPGVVEHESDWIRSSIYTVETNTLIFTGGLASEFNRQSLIYFLNWIWPIIIKEIKNVKLFVVGQTIEDYFEKKIAHPNIIYTGRVQSVRKYIERAAVFVSPITCGTGIKTKIVEALRYGKPIVTTPEGIGGLWEINPNCIKVKSDPVKFGKEVIRLLNDDSYRIETSLNSRKLFEEHYSFNSIAPTILGIYDNLL